MIFVQSAMVTTVLSVLLAVAVPTLSRGEQGEEARFLRNSHKLTYQGKRAGEGYFSPDGQQLIFQAEREETNPFYQIYILNLTSGETNRVSPGEGKTTCAFFHPHSLDVLWASTHMDPDAKAKQKAELEFRASGKERRYSFDYDETFDIFVSDRDGRGVRRLTDATGYDAECAFSPDGGKIIFSSIRDAYPVKNLPDEDSRRIEVDPSYFAEIYIMDADGSNQQRLTRWRGYDGGPFFSPDGSRIIWRHFDESGLLADIYTMLPDGSGRRRLTDFDAMNWAPYFHPTGQYVIFTSNKHGFDNFELFIVDAHGTKEPVRITTTDGFDGLPAFSPDGTKLAWTSIRGGGAAQLFLAGWNHDAALAAIEAAPVRAGMQGVGTSSQILAADMREDVGYLASDELEGRMTGSDGERLAADYIAKRFESLGLRPLGDDGGYYQEFPFTSGIDVVKDDNDLAVESPKRPRKQIRFKLDKDFRPLPFTSNGEVEGDVVFAGYGLKVPGDRETGYDSYSGLDVKDKVVLVLRYVPEEVEMERRQQLNRFAGLRYKAMLAREAGAKALLIVAGPNSPDAGKLAKISFDQSLASSGIVVASISGKVAEALFAGSGKSLKDAQIELDIENPHAEVTFELPGARVKIKARVERKTSPARNVVALIRPFEDDPPAEYIVIGAHYDHIGHGEIGSLARKGEENKIHNGADDNASGTAMVLELAAALADARSAEPEAFRRAVVIALWSGEELGIIGSSYFVTNPPIELDRIAAYLNFDMVGRLRDNTVMLQGIGSSSAWRALIEKKNVAVGFDLTLQEDPYLPTDVTAFYPKEIPVMSFFTGSHEDYNRPTDDPETLDYDGMERIGKLSYAMIMDLVSRDDRPEYVKVERKKSRQGQRGGMRAYLGTIPDYATSDVEGVKLSGVRAGGPADKAGLLGGDVIVEFAGQKITNIYDYTYALEAVKIGKPVEVVVLRDGLRVILTVVPEMRQ
ncbi:MAG: M28 family peptidase [bacterium]|nr:M28 family peptidase [bacterium]